MYLYLVWFVLFLLCFLYCSVYVYLLFILSVLVQGLLPPSENSIAVSSSTNKMDCWLLQRISTLRASKLHKICQVSYNSNYNVCLLQLIKMWLCGCWLFIQSIVSGIVFLVAPIPVCRALRYNSRYSWLYIQPPTT